MPETKYLKDLKKTWQARIYNEESPSDPVTLFAQLSRLATHRATYLSLMKMTMESEVNIGDVMRDCLRDGYYADLIMTTRRLLETNPRKKNGDLKNIERAVISIQSFAEDLSRAHADECLIEDLKSIKSKMGEAPNKVFHHNDFQTAIGERELKLATESDYDDVIIGLKNVLLKGCLTLNITIPDKLVPTNQFDWAKSFDKPWRSIDFDDSGIWDDPNF